MLIVGYVGIYEEFALRGALWHPQGKIRTYDLHLLPFSAIIEVYFTQYNHHFHNCFLHLFNLVYIHYSLPNYLHPDPSQNSRPIPSGKTLYPRRCLVSFPAPIKSPTHTYAHIPTLSSHPLHPRRVAAVYLDAHLYSHDPPARAHPHCSRGRKVEKWD